MLVLRFEGFGGVRIFWVFDSFKMIDFWRSSLGLEIRCTGGLWLGAGLDFGWWQRSLQKERTGGVVGSLN